MPRPKMQAAKSIRLTEISQLEYVPSGSVPALPVTEGPKHKRFELCVANTLQLLNPDATVEHNAKMLGQSGCGRQIDVLLRSRKGDATVVEAKAHKRVIDIGPIDKLIGCRDDLGISNATMVATSGFSRGARARALTAGIELKRLIDTQSEEWGTAFSIPAWCELTQVEEIRAELRTPGKLVHVDPSSAEFACFYLEHARGRVRLFKLGRAIANALYESTIDFDEGKNDFEFLDGPLFLYDAKRPDLRYAAELSLSIEVSKKVLYGDLPLSCVRGFEDVLTGVVSASFKIMPGDLDLDALIPEWRESPGAEGDGAAASLGIGAIGIAPDLLEELL